MKGHYVCGMQIDQDERRHSHLYELKPMSRWWLALLACLWALGIAVNGFFNPGTWYLLLMGTFGGFALILVFPKYWLSRLD